MDEDTMEQSSAANNVNASDQSVNGKDCQECAVSSSPGSGDGSNTASRRKTRSQGKQATTSGRNSAGPSKPKKKKAKREGAMVTNTNFESLNCKSVISESKQFDYENIKIADDVVDRYTKRSIVLSADEEKLRESPENRRLRIQMIARQGRLHPANKQYNQGPVSYPPLISPGVLVGYTPAGQRHQVDLNAERPTWFNSEYARMQFDCATQVNAKRMMHDLQTGHFLPECLDATKERKYFAQRELAREGAAKHFRTVANTGKQTGNSNLARITTETLSLLDAEQSLIKMNEFAAVKLNDFPDELTNQINMALSLRMTPLMFKKNPILLQTIEKLASQKMHWHVSKSAQALLVKVKDLFKVPKSLSFHEFFASEVEKLRERIKDMAVFDIIVMTEEPADKNKLEGAAEKEDEEVDSMVIVDTSSRPVDNERMALVNNVPRIDTDDASEADRSESDFSMAGEPEE